MARLSIVNVPPAREAVNPAMRKEYFLVRFATDVSNMEISKKACE
jgi:hypothetical protein